MSTPYRERLLSILCETLAELVPWALPETRAKWPAFIDGWLGEYHTKPEDESMETMSMCYVDFNGEPSVGVNDDGGVDYSWQSRTWGFTVWATSTVVRVRPVAWYLYVPVRPGTPERDVDFVDAITERFPSRFFDNNETLQEQLDDQALESM